VRPFSLILGVAYLLENIGAALLLTFFATFPFENQSPEDRAARELISAGIVMAFLALVTLALIVRHRRSAAAAFAANAAVALSLLTWAVGESDHSDGKLVAWALAVELTGLSAIAVALRDRQRD
jgi:hypothetical protein